MSRKEFGKATKDAAWVRSGGRCEATGNFYGLPPGQRCDTDLKTRGVEYDHIDCDAHSKDNSLENCAAVCKPCHRWKTDHVDTPKIAKSSRIDEKSRNLRKRAGRGLPTRDDRLRALQRMAERAAR